MPKILYKFPSRQRVEKFKATIKNILEMAHHDDFLILVSIDRDDLTISEVIEWCGKNRLVTALGGKVYLQLGYSKSKVEAVNADLPFNDWDILIVPSDDMVFLVPGFDLQIIKDFGDDLDQLLHYPDGYANESLITLPIMGRPYYDRFGYVYNSDYASLFCDNEQHEVAKELGKYKFCPIQLFVHNHHIWTGAIPDELGKRNDELYRRDQRVYNKRKALGFPKESVFS